MQRHVESSGEMEWKTPFIFPEGDVTRKPMRKGRKSKDYQKTRLLCSLDVAGKSVLDFGCSEGIYSFYLARSGANVTGIDIDALRIERANYAKQRLGFPDVRFECSPTLPTVTQEFDLAVAYGFLHRISDPINFVLDVGSVAKNVALEWRCPALLPGKGLGIAVHNPSGNFEWKNINRFSEIKWLTDPKNSRKNEIADFWRVSPSVVMSLLRRIGFSEFRLTTVRREYGLTSIPLAIGRWTIASFAGEARQLRWPYSERAHLVASRSALTGVLGKVNTRFQPAEWDGRFSSKVGRSDFVGKMP